MSYSISARGKNAADVIEKLGAELDNAIGGQPMHKHDREAHLASAKALVEVLPGNLDGKDIYVSMTGSIGWNQVDGEDADAAKERIISTGVNINTYLVDAES